MTSLFKDYPRRHFHPLGARIIGWNILLLIIVKLIFPQSALQLASFVNSIPAFDSREIIKFTNESRIAKNLPPLKANAQLDLAASKKLNDMAVKEYFAHISPAGINPWFWVKESQYQYLTAGENLAIGFPTAKETVLAWLDSPSHRDNILNNRYIDIGVAVKAVEIDGDNGILVVQMFGSPIQTASSVIKPVPTKTPTPVQVAVFSPSVSPIISPITQTKGESVTIQYVSTNEDLPPITKPLTIEYEDADNVKAISKTFSNVFSVYAFAIALLSILALILFERNRSMALKMSLNVAMFITSIAIPATQITLTALVF